MQRSIQQLYEVILLDLEQVQKDMSWKAPGYGNYVFVLQIGSLLAA